MRGWLLIFVVLAGQPNGLFAKTPEWNQAHELYQRTEYEQATHEREVRELRAKVGEWVLELDARKKAEALRGKPETAF